MRPAGNCTQGEVLDVETITNEAHVPYDGTSAMWAVLDPSNRWTVSASPL